MGLSAYLEGGGVFYAFFDWKQLICNVYQSSYDEPASPLHTCIYHAFTIRSPHWNK